MDTKNAIVDYSDDSYHKKRHLDPAIHDAYYRAWSEYAAKVYFPPSLKDARILEVGAAYGYNLYTLAEDNCCFAVEPSPAALAIAKSMGISGYLSIAEIPKGDKYDYVLLRHVLEHVLHPPIFLAEISNFLDNSGRIIVVLPCEKSVESPVKSEIDNHLYCWNARTFTNLVSAIGAGFELESFRINYFNCRRLFLPARKLLGPYAYMKAIEAAGRLFPGNELIAVIKKH
jgi:SAM-dependent methyltransferase